MCGVIGIISINQQVSFDLYNGLLDLQHRGQDTCGMITLNQDKVFIHKGSGLVAKVFDEKTVNSLLGRMGIAQVRYPTTKGKVDAQPFYEDCGGICLAHNGNIYNDEEVRASLQEKRLYCDSDCDAETILKLLTHYFMSSDKPIMERCFESAEQSMRDLNGSYSTIAVIRGEGFFAFRDPRGIRPLLWGVKRNELGEPIAYAFASESVALESIVDEIEDVKHGEAIYIDMSMKVTRKILLQEQPKHCMFEWVYFSRATSKLQGKSVNRVRGNLGKKLAEIYLKSPLYERLKQTPEKVIVAAVPETARPASVVFARHTGYEYKDVLEKNRFVGRIFIKPSESLRRHEVATNLKAIEEVVQNKIVLLVDDSIVRGTTSQGIVDKIRKKGAKEIHIFSTCPPIQYPCFYGVDFPTKQELISSSKNAEELAEFIDADSVTFMDIESLSEAIGLDKDNLCLACLNGEYPTLTK
ncbi:amidophosphoribosyltransferase [bacterium]|nr:amidophosphoribosyltransferase [bacterium]